MDCMETRLVPAGTVVRLEQTGGGDYGDPFDPKRSGRSRHSTEMRNDGKDHQRAHARRYVPKGKSFEVAQDGRAPMPQRKLWPPSPCDVPVL